MNGEDILKGMNYIDEKFIGPAAPKRNVRRKIWVRWTAAAACFALLCVGLFQWLPSVAHASQDLMEQMTLQGLLAEAQDGQFTVLTLGPMAPEVLRYGLRVRIRVQ